MLHEDKLRSEGCVHEVSCLDGETEPDDKLEGEGGVGEAPLWCCQGVLPGGDNVTGTTFFTANRTVQFNSVASAQSGYL